MFGMDPTNGNADQDIQQQRNTEHSVPSRVEEMDERDLLQLALDEICDLQKELAREEVLEDEDAKLSAIVGEPIREDDAVMAGFDFCAKEALRFLVEEEHLAPEHPVVRELSAHISAQKRSVDCVKVMSEYHSAPSQHKV